MPGCLCREGKAARTFSIKDAFQSIGRITQPYCTPIGGGYMCSSLFISTSILNKVRFTDK